MNIRQKNLPVAILERIDDRCAAFEKGWQSGNPVSIESILSQDVAAEEKEVLLAELIVLETDYLRRRGESARKQDFLNRFPDHHEIIESVWEEGNQAKRAFQIPSLERVSELFPSLDVLEMLGAGGMGAVYKAKQQGLDRVVALKILPEELARDAKFSLRFTREARTLAKLNHNNIVSVYEFGSVQDTYFFLMEFVDGPTLRDVVRAGQLEPKHALSIVPHLCDALQYAHDNGVIHRDIKPENILLTASGTVKIVDFGLSRLLGNTGPSQGLTATNQAMGTPRYMAPEQFEGAHQVDHRADIYSLGVVFYELLTGELPIGRFAVPSQKVSIDVRLDEVVLRTLEKEPGLRYQAASEIKSDLQSIAETNDPALAVTETTSRAAFPSERTFETRSQSRNSAADLDHQASAARLLLTRRNLMDRVRKSLGPLCRWQVIQIMFGVGFIALGAACWARNTDVPHRLVSGVALHVFGVSWIAAAAGVLTRVKRVDYSLPSDAVREGISGARDLYLRVSLLIGFPWWLMWIPLAIAMGFDAMMYPGALLPSLAIGIVGWAVSLWIYFRTVNSKHSDLEMRKRNIAGSSFSNALKLLDEMVESGIR